MIVPVTISSELVVRVDDLPVGQADLLKSALCFKNEEREKAAKLKTFGFWDLPEYISIWREEKRRDGDHVLCLPRGFAAQLAGGLASAGATIEWNDLRSVAQATPGYFRPFLLRDYQAEFVSSLMKAEQGVGMAPAGSGKTTSLLGMMAMLQQRCIVIVDKEALAEQWRERAAQFLGLSTDLPNECSVGKIGKGVWEERDLTICLRQTLFSRQWQTDAIDWASRWGLCVIDECHHMGSASSLQDVVRAIPCKYIFGVSATPARSETQGLITGALIGPLVAQTQRQALVDAGILVHPTVRVVETNFKSDFWDDHESDVDGRCKKPGCTKKNQHGHRNNWASVLKTLVEDEDRNRLIAESIATECGHVHLVPSRQKKHLDLLEDAIVEAGWDGPIYKLRGKENADGLSKEITDSVISSREAVLLSTVADEGLDVPPLDRVHMCFPLRQGAATIQIVGRVERSFPGKTSAVIVDYRDPGCSVFDDQHHERMRTYRGQGLALEYKTFDERPPTSRGGGEGWAACDQESVPPVGKERAQPALRPRIYSKLDGADPVPPDAIYVGRPTIWGNRFVVGEDGTQTECVELYRAWLNGPDGAFVREQAALQLRGKDLVCWCRSPSEDSPAPCHAEVLLEVANNSEMVVLICGSHGWGDRPMIERYVKKIIGEVNGDRHLVVIHGGAKGADTIAGEVAADLGVDVRVFEANWSRGQSAGNARNIEMLDQRPERVGAFSLGTSGTRHTVEVARERGIDVDLHGPKGLVRA